MRRSMDEEPDFYDEGDSYCQHCGGEGWIIDCIDDICHGVGYCIHGDGMVMCSCNDGDKFPANAPADYKLPTRAGRRS